jgi:undecaprenyl-diphosphatase
MLTIEQIDVSLADWVFQRQTAFEDRLFRGITRLGDEMVLASMALVGTMVLVLLRRYRASLLFPMIACAAWGLSDGTKILVQRHRPRWSTLHQWENYSFPSGHTLGATAVYGMFAVLMARRARRRSVSWLCLAGAGAVSLAVGVSRVCLGVHFPLDVVGGWLGGLALVLLGCWLDSKWNAAELAPGQP